MTETKRYKPANESNARRRQIIWHCLSLSAISVVVWISSVNCEFVWIDHVEIEQAGYRVTSYDDLHQVWTQSLDSYLERRGSQSQLKGGYYRPLYALLISLDWQLWGNNPSAFHWTSILIHISVVIGLYFLGQQILPESSIQPWLAFVAALLFSIHPFGVHSVTWISGRKDSACALFSIIALLSLGSLLSNNQRRGMFQQIFLVLIATVSLNLAILCKELAIVVPAFASIWIWYGMQHARPNKVLTLLCGLFWLTSLGALVLRQSLLGGVGLGDVDYPSVSWLANVFTSAKLVCFYILRIILPIDPTIVDRWPVVDSTGPVEIVAALGLVILLATWLTLLYRRNIVGLMLSWFLIWLLPASGIVPLRHMYAERYLYPASWGLLLLFLFVTHQRFHIWFKRDEPFHASWICVAILFAIQTVDASRFWVSDEKLFTHAVQQDPQYAEGLSALALIQYEQGQDAKSLEFANRAIKSGMNPGFRSYWSPFITYSNAGLASLRHGNLDDSLGFFEKARDCRPNYVFSYYHLGLVETARGEMGTAMNHYQTALSIDSEHHLTRNNLAYLFLVRQSFDDCINLLIPTVSAEPENRLARTNLATAYLLKKDFANAEKNFRVLAQQDTKDHINLAKLAWSEFELGDRAAAKIHLAAAKRLAPLDPTVIFVDQQYSQTPR